MALVKPDHVFLQASHVRDVPLDSGNTRSQVTHAMLCWRPVRNVRAHFRSYLAESNYKVILQTSIPVQIRRLIFCMTHQNGQFDGFAWELTSAK